MNEETVTFLKDLSNAPLFSRCGTLPDSQMSEPVRVVRTGSEARDLAMSKSWRTHKNAIANRRKELNFASAEFDFLKSQRSAVEIIKAVDAILNKAVKRTSILELRDKKIVDEIRFDLRGIASEIESSNSVQPLFFVPALLPWYEAGHFPCGWDGMTVGDSWKGQSRGDLPDGVVCVF